MDSSTARYLAHQRLGLVKTAGFLQQLRKVVEAASDPWMRLAETGLINGQRPPHQRLGLDGSRNRSQQLREIGEVCGDGRMPVAVTGFTNGQRLRISSSASPGR